MASIIAQLEIVLLVTAIVGMLARRLRVPTTVGLVLAGIGLALLRGTISITLTKDLIFDAFLPPLVFEASLYIDWRELRKDLAVILTLATLGVLLTAGATTVGMHYFARWSWEGAALFGILMSATDPVSVITTFKEAGLHGRLRLLLESESLFNDGIAAAAFSAMLVFLTGEKLTAGAVGLGLAAGIAGGILCGATITWGVLFLAGQTKDHLTEITLTTVAAYGSFLLADRMHFSGVFASLTAGLIVGNAGFLWSIYSREAVESFWEYAAFVANAFIFILIGIQTGEQHFAGVGTLVPVAVAITLVGRAVAIYPCCALFARSTLRVEARHQHILFWGGLRGALALALALGLPAELPYREEIITTAFIIVAFSIFAQGLTMAPLLRRLGEVSKSTRAIHGAGG
jgi:CPA1 family monovalent cation:H+ antiporter